MTIQGRERRTALRLLCGLRKHMGQMSSAGLALLLTALFGLAVVTPLQAQQQEEQGFFEDLFSAGEYDDDGRYEDDWFYDTYNEPSQESRYGNDWYGDQAYYEGRFDEGPADDDWYYDLYLDGQYEDWWD